MQDPGFLLTFASIKICSTFLLARNLKSSLFSWLCLKLSIICHFTLMKICLLRSSESPSWHTTSSWREGNQIICKLCIPFPATSPRMSVQDLPVLVSSRVPSGHQVGADLHEVVEGGVVCRQSEARLAWAVGGCGVGPGPEEGDDGEREMGLRYIYIYVPKRDRDGIYCERERAVGNR